MMTYKHTLIGLLLVFCSCGSNNALFQKSKYETVYSRTITEDDFESVHNILKEHLIDFPEMTKRKISYASKSDAYALNVLLKRTQFKLTYKSDVGYDSKITAIKSKIEALN